ncbi:MAG: MMPL family transporter [Opitutaceae bacterium]|nr:MMPL family transporter [Opitutaceae bacterium]
MVPHPTPRLEWYARWIMGRPRAVIVAWCVALAVAAPFALRLGRVAHGGSEAIRGSESHAVMMRLNADFGRGAAHPIPVVVIAPEESAARLPAVVADLTARLTTDARIHRVTHAWNTGWPELIGRDGHSALLLVQADAELLIDAENFTAELRALLAARELPSGFSTHVTGMAAMFHDLNRRSSADLLRAESVGVPLTLLVLFLAFRTVFAAALALAIAAAAVVLSSAFLYVASIWLPVSTLAQNVITMIGLGAGTDYALFVLSHYRHERRDGHTAEGAVLAAIHRAGPAIVVAGIAVAGGFAALFLVNARFVQSLALGGIAVIATAVAATLTLLPALLHFGADRVLPAPRRAVTAVRSSGWAAWSTRVMRRPWTYLALALALCAPFGWSALRAQAWKITAQDLPADEESRRGYDLLVTQFQPGWMGPTVLTLDAKPGRQIWEPEYQHATLALASELQRHPSIAHVLGYPRWLDAIGPSRLAIGAGALPPELAETAHSIVSADGRTAVMILVPRVAPEMRDVIELVKTLRAGPGSKTPGAQLQVNVGGGTAIIHDFDVEMFQSVGRVIVAVMLLTFVLLLVVFRSLAVPAKAVAANLLSVIVAYGFLVLVFQDGHGARLLGIEPPGGLNSFVVLMLFTVLFGLSMDYEIFLLSEVRDRFRAGATNIMSVAGGLGATAGIITSAAAVMVCLFGSFGFFGLTASRQFGLGLAVAVAFDATIVRLLIVPATMRLLGDWNWWLPTFPGRLHPGGPRFLAAQAGRR